MISRTRSTTLRRAVETARRRDRRAVRVQPALEPVEHRLARPRVRAEIPVAEAAHVPRVDELLEQPRDGKTQHRLAEIQRLADQVVPAVDHRVGAPGEVFEDAPVVVRLEREVAAPVFGSRCRSRRQ